MITWNKFIWNVHVDHILHVTSPLAVTPLFQNNPWNKNVFQLFLQSCSSKTYNVPQLMIVSHIDETSQTYWFRILETEIGLFCCIIENHIDYLLEVWRKIVEKFWIAWKMLSNHHLDSFDYLLHWKMKSIGFYDDLLKHVIRHN